MIATHRTGRDGLARLTFARDGQRTAVTRARSAVPLQVLAPVALPDRAAVVWLLNPTGGLVGGDRLSIEVDVGPGAHACVTTPSATKVYRATGEASVQDVRLRLEPDAVLEWVPDHTIPFPGAAFRQRLVADVGDDATLFLIDAFAAGRIARDEAWRFALLESALTIRDRAGLVLSDRFVLARRDAGEPPWAELGFTETHPYFGSVVVVTDVAPDAFRQAVDGVARRLREARLAAARLPRRGVLVRCLAPTAPVLHDVVAEVWAAARRDVLGAPPLALRKP